MSGDDDLLDKMREHPYFKKAREAPESKTGGASQQISTEIRLQLHNEERARKAVQRAEETIAKFNECFEREGQQAAALLECESKYGLSASKIRKAFGKLGLPVPK